MGGGDERDGRNVGVMLCVVGMSGGKCGGLGVRRVCEVICYLLLLWCV